MAAQPAPKRRRLDTNPQDNETSTYTLVHRRDDDLRLSMQDLYASLDRYGDVIVCVHGENGSEEFACISALLASASRPLGAMLFGHMAATEPALVGASDARKRLHLNMTEPEHFKHLLLYIHGQDIPLEIDEAFQMHHVADFYEVLGLRDACCRFLLESLRPHNCCHLLTRATEVHCEPLVQRCFDMLTLDFIAVAEHDPEFPQLTPQCLEAIITRDELVCAEEFEVFEAITSWYHRCPTLEKHTALPQLLNLVRWPLIQSERRADVVALTTARLRPPRAATSGLVSDDGCPPPQQQRSPLAASKKASPKPPPRAVPEFGDSENDEEMLETVDDSNGDDEHDDDSGCEQPSVEKERSMLAPSPYDDSEAEAEATLLLQSLWPESTPRTPASADEPSTSAEASRRVHRQYFWGQLISRNPPQAAAPPAAATAESEQIYQLQSTKEYMVGRSRKSDIRVGHQAPMPYISSQHFRIFHAIKWPELVSGNMPLADGEQRAPVLEAWIEDLSQNGTFINGTQIGKNKSQVLRAGDRIEMVFPLGRQMPQQTSGFPIFTFQPHRPAPFAAPISSTDADTGTPAGCPLDGPALDGPAYR